MMEAIMTHRVTPLLKCFVLFLFIFTAKVLTSRPNEAPDSRNGIHHVKPSHYVRTFTKYHHRRTIQWNNHELQTYWPVTPDQPKVNEKRSINSDWPNETQKQGPEITISNDFRRNRRSVPVSDSNEFVVQSIPDLNQFSSDLENVVNFKKTAISSGKEDHSTKNVLANDVRKYNVKAAFVPTDPPTTIGPTISCLYKIHSVAKSVTPSYIEDTDAQLMVESDHYDPGSITDTELPTGPAQIEKCSDPKATCYTLWHQDNEGNITVLGQGRCCGCRGGAARQACLLTRTWTASRLCCVRAPPPPRARRVRATRNSLLHVIGDRMDSRLIQHWLGLHSGCWRSATSQSEGRSSCDKCTRVTARLPGTQMFCCCTKSLCNADFASIKEETITIKAESTMEATAAPNKYSNLVASAVLALVAIMVMATLLHKMYCTRVEPEDVEKGGEVMGSGPDALATGLLCVDNLTLIEHIGQGKFGSVWRGTLGSTPVAVKLYSNASAWQKEAAIYALPHLSHSNILRYYGSDTRPTLTEGCREHLIVLELCACTLRSRLERAPLTWIEFASLAHGVASALAHLHTPTGNKPCIVHRDVNSNNVLISADGSCRLADLGLAQTHRPRPANTAPTRYTEAGTLRYLAPEALEGALDLSGAGAALCAVDVFALALVLWEMLWRTAGAHAAGRAPPYAPPYHLALPPAPTLTQMQTLVSRNKVRPPLPKGPVPEMRALKIATDTCEECWDHDAEARLTAVCVEERMNELKHVVCAQPPLIHDNKFSQPHPPDPNISETDKNSNVQNGVVYDVTTPLLYPHAHIGRNACIERNTNTNTPYALPLVHKSLKDITVNTEVPRQNFDENCLSVARISRTRLPVQENSMNEIRSYQRPLDYVQNDVSSQDSDRAPKDTNLLHDIKVEKPKWGIRKFFEKLNRKETVVKLYPESTMRIKTSIVDKPMNAAFDRPSNLVLDEDRYYEAPCLSPPNRTLSPTMMESKVFKELPPRECDSSNQIFAVIVPKAKVQIRSQNSKGSTESINKSVRNSMSSQSMLKSESEDSTVKKRLSSDQIVNSASSSRASINLELQYIDNSEFSQISPFDLNTDTSSSEDENLMLLSENGGSKITMQTIPKEKDVLKETTKTDYAINKLNNYTNFDNELSDPNDKENLVTYSVDNPVYLAAFNGEISTDLKEDKPKPCLKSLSIKRQHSLEHVSELFSSAGDVNLLNPAGRVKTPGDLPVAVRRARSRALQKGRASETNRLSLYDDRMMFGNSL